MGCAWSSLSRQPRSKVAKCGVAWSSNVLAETPQGEVLAELFGPLLQLPGVRVGTKAYKCILDIFLNYLEGLLQAGNRPQVFYLAARAAEVSWGIQDVLESFCDRGWLLRMKYVASFEQMLNEQLHQLQPVLAEGGVEMSKSDLEAWTAAMTELREAGSALAQRLCDANLQQLAADANRRTTFITSLLPLVNKMPNETEAELRSEVQFELEHAIMMSDAGPHLAIRHMDLRYFWYISFRDADEVTWRQFWSQLKDFLGNLPSTVRRDLGDLQALLSLVCDHDMQSRIEAAVQARSSLIVAACELDAAVMPGLSLHVNLSWLIRLHQRRLLGAGASSGSRQSATAQVFRHVPSNPLPVLQEDNDETAPAEPGGADAGGGSEALLPPMSHSIMRLVGRARDLDELAQGMRSPHMRITVIHGPQGAGKSALVRSMSMQLIAARAWCSVATVDCRHITSVEEAVLSLCSALSVLPAPWKGVADAQQDLRRHVRAKQGSNPLKHGLVLDNCEGLLQAPGSTKGQAAQAKVLEVLKEVLDAAPTMQLVLVGTWPQEEAEALDNLLQPTVGSSTECLFMYALQPLSQESAAALFAMHAGPEHSLPIDQFAAVCATCNNLPAMLRLAGSAIKQHAVGAVGLECLVLECQGKEPTQERQSPEGHPKQLEAGIKDPGEPASLTVGVSRRVFTSLSHHHQAALQVLSLVQVSLPMEEIELLLMPLLHHPCAVRAALCRFYDLGFFHFHDQTMMHEMDSCVRLWVQRFMEEQPAEDSMPYVEAVVQAAEAVVEEASAMHRNGARMASMHRFGYRRPLFDHGIRAAGRWVQQRAPWSAASQGLVSLLARHLNDYLPIVSTSSQMVELAQLAAQLAPFLPEEHMQSVALLTAARAFAAEGGGSSTRARTLLSEAEAVAQTLSPASSIPLSPSQGLIRGVMTPARLASKTTSDLGSHRMASMRGAMGVLSTLSRHGTNVDQPTQSGLPVLHDQLHLTGVLTPQDLVVLTQAELSLFQGELHAASSLLESCISSLCARPSPHMQHALACMLLQQGDVWRCIAQPVDGSSRLRPSGNSYSSDRDTRSSSRQASSTADHDAGGQQRTKGMAATRASSHLPLSQAEALQKAASTYERAYELWRSVWGSRPSWLVARVCMRWAGVQAQLEALGLPGQTVPSPVSPQKRSVGGLHHGSTTPSAASTNCRNSVELEARIGLTGDALAHAAECIKVHARTQGSWNEDVAECKMHLGRAQLLSMFPEQGKGGAGSSPPKIPRDTPPIALSAQQQQGQQGDALGADFAPWQLRRAPQTATRASTSLSQASPAIDTLQDCVWMLLEMYGETHAWTIEALESLAQAVEACGASHFAASTLSSHAKVLRFAAAVSSSDPDALTKGSVPQVPARLQPLVSLHGCRASTPTHHVRYAAEARTAAATMLPTAVILSELFPDAESKMRSSLTGRPALGAASRGETAAEGLATADASAPAPSSVPEVVAEGGSSPIGRVSSLSGTPARLGHKGSQNDLSAHTPSRIRPPAISEAGSCTSPTLPAPPDAAAAAGSFSPRVHVLPEALAAVARPVVSSLDGSAQPLSPHRKVWPSPRQSPRGGGVSITTAATPDSPLPAPPISTPASSGNRPYTTPTTTPSTPSRSPATLGGITPFLRPRSQTAHTLGVKSSGGSKDSHNRHGRGRHTGSELSARAPEPAWGSQLEALKCVSPSSSTQDARTPVSANLLPVPTHDLMLAANPLFTHNSTYHAGSLAVAASTSPSTYGGGIASSHTDGSGHSSARLPYREYSRVHEAPSEADSTIRHSVDFEQRLSRA